MQIDGAHTRKKCGELWRPGNRLAIRACLRCRETMLVFPLTKLFHKQHQELQGVCSLQDGGSGP